MDFMDRIEKLSFEESKELDISSAKDLINNLYMNKIAAITTPSKKEVKEVEEKSDLEEIKCENCDYEGETTVYGECPNCGAIGGIKPSEVRNLREETDYNYNDPYEGVSVYDSDHMDRQNL